MVAVVPLVIDFTPQKLKLSTILKMLNQCADAMRHMHSIKLLHRDFRSPNVLVLSTRPIKLMVTDFGLSYDLSRAPNRKKPGTSRSPIHSPDEESVVLKGDEALGPLQWMAPETIATTPEDGRVATYPSDRYMFGGLMFEVPDTRARRAGMWLPFPVNDDVVWTEYLHHVDVFVVLCVAGAHGRAATVFLDPLCAYVQRAPTARCQRVVRAQ